MSPQSAEKPRRAATHVVPVSADGRLLLLRLHQLHVSLVVADLRQRAGDVRLLEHLRGRRGAQTGSDRTLLDRKSASLTSSSKRS